MMGLDLGSVDVEKLGNGIVTKNMAMTTGEMVDNKREDSKKENETTDSSDRVYRDINGKVIDVEEVMWRT